ncbi:Casparian strip membrane protein domain [Arabidopsis suecica]|uniref:CASP-like protein n=1 Tax=Arabidopsis suecica TaxID=45249 RepID=A0A8T1YME8_ARASU|nr:Casparian strip membrane protein domain [Arabidopsis suecica]
MEHEGKNNKIGMEMEKGKRESGSRKGVELTMRVLALVLTMTAATVLGVAKQTKVVSIKLIPTLPPLDITTTAKASYLSAFVYNISANAIACGYTTISIAILMISRGRRSKKLLMAVLLGDLVMVALLFSGTGAASAIGLMGLQGNKHVMWKKVCGVFGKFCHRAAPSLPLTLLAAVVFMFLVVLDAIKLP